jgi:hypothetical protein
MHLTNCPPPLVERTKQEQSALRRKKDREVQQAVRLEDLEEAAAAVVANGNHTGDDGCCSSRDRINWQGCCQGQ